MTLLSLRRSTMTSSQWLRQQFQAIDERQAPLAALQTARTAWMTFGAASPSGFAARERTLPWRRRLPTTT